MLRLWIFLFCTVIFTASCEDKKSSEEIDSAPEREIEKVQEEEKAPDKEDSNEEDSEETAEGPLIVQEKFIPFMTEYGKNNPEDKVRIKTRFGNIDVQLFHDTPLHRANFIFLVKNDYFDDTYFHRVAKGFVIQGGNSDKPTTNEKRHRIGSYLIPSEFEAGHRHVRGAFAAAKYAEQNVSKASSPYEFYIVQSPEGAPHLDNDHTVFGKVIDGMDVVDKIAQVKTDSGEWPLHNIYLDVEILD